jgi:hypothetical protein
MKASGSRNFAQSQCTVPSDLLTSTRFLAVGRSGRQIGRRQVARMSGAISGASLTACYPAFRCAHAGYCCQTILKSQKPGGRSGLGGLGAAKAAHAVFRRLDRQSGSADNRSDRCRTWRTLRPRCRQHLGRMDRRRSPRSAYEPHALGHCGAPVRRRRTALAAIPAAQGACGWIGLAAHVLGCAWCCL